MFDIANTIFKLGVRLAPTLAALAALAAALVLVSSALVQARALFAGVSDNVWCLVSWVGVPQAFGAFLAGLVVAVTYRLAVLGANAILGLVA